MNLSDKTQKYPGFKDTLKFQRNIKICYIVYKHIPIHKDRIEIVGEELFAILVQTGYSVTCCIQSDRYVYVKEFDESALEECKVEICL